MSNESKWLTAIGGIVAAIVPLLIAYGILTNEQGELWHAFIMALAALIVPIVVGSIVKNYNDNDTAARVALMENETARLMASTPPRPARAFTGPYDVTVSSASTGGTPV